MPAVKTSPISLLPHDSSEPIFATCSNIMMSVRVEFCYVS
jgi:hypothetical protein